MSGEPPPPSNPDLNEPVCSTGILDDDYGTFYLQFFLQFQLWFLLQFAMWNGSGWPWCFFSHMIPHRILIAIPFTTLVICIQSHLQWNWHSSLKREYRGRSVRWEIINHGQTQVSSWKLHKSKMVQREGKARGGEAW